jgi:predicted DNA-binding transcriptional regulator AlpA
MLWEASLQINTDEPILNPVELAQRLGVHKQTVLSWRQHGSGPKYFRLNRYFFYRLTDIEIWEAEQKAAREPR